MRCFCAILTSGILLALAACDSDGGTEEAVLTSGTFEVTTTGAVNDQFEGEATFAKLPGLLVLTLRTGTFQPPGRPYTIDTGFFLGAVWQGRPGEAPLSQGGPFESRLLLPLPRSFGFPVPFAVESGTLTIEAATAERVEGHFEFVAVDVVALEVEGERHEVEAYGRFIAVPAVEE